MPTNKSIRGDISRATSFKKSAQKKFKKAKKNSIGLIEVRTDLALSEAAKKRALKGINANLASTAKIKAKLGTGKKRSVGKASGRKKRK